MNSNKNDWRKKYPKDADDLAYWEQLFKGNIIGWTYKSEALVRIGKTSHSIKHDLMEFMLDLKRGKKS